MKYLFKKRYKRFLAGVFDLIGHVLTLIFRRRTGRLASEDKTILLIRLDHIGDVLRCTGIPKLLKESVRGCRIVFLTSSPGAELLKHNPFVDEVLTFDAGWFSRRPRSAAGDNLWRLAGRLKKMRVDIGVSLRGDLRENILMVLAGIPERIGYGVTGGGFLLTREQPYRRLAHEDERMIESLKPLGIGSVKPPAPALYFIESERDALTAKSVQWGLKGQRRVGLQANAGTTAKDWPSGHMDTFARLFSQKFGPERCLILTGSESRADLKESGVVDLTGKTTLRQLCLLMQTMDLFIGPDSGPTHLAAALGVPTYFLYSGTNSLKEWGPKADNARVFSNPVPCAPCGLKTCVVPGHPCMTQIQPQSLLDAMEEKWPSRP